VARISANEGALHSHADAALVWQATRVNGDRARDGRAGWLSRHSPAVAGRRACARGNCRWSPYLARDGRFPTGLAVTHDFWRVRVRPAWLSLLQYVDDLVLNDRDDDDPCAIEPATWGGKMDIVGARARGLYPIGCVGTLNDGFATARTCTVNGEWRCAPLDAPAARARARLTVRAEVAAGGAR